MWWTRMLQLPSVDRSIYSSEYSSPRMGTRWSQRWQHRFWQHRNHHLHHLRHSMKESGVLASIWPISPSVDPDETRWLYSSEFGPSIKWEALVHPSRTQFKKPFALTSASISLIYGDKLATHVIRRAIHRLTFSTVVDILTIFHKDTMLRRVVLLRRYQRALLTVPLPKEVSSLGISVLVFLVYLVGQIEESRRLFCSDVNSPQLAVVSPKHCMSLYAFPR